MTKVDQGKDEHRALWNYTAIVAALTWAGGKRTQVRIQAGYLAEFGEEVDENPPFESRVGSDPRRQGA